MDMLSIGCLRAAIYRAVYGLRYAATFAGPCLPYPVGGITGVGGTQEGNGMSKPHPCNGCPAFCNALKCAAVPDTKCLIRLAKGDK